MVDEGEGFTMRREAHVTDPANGLVKRLSEGVFYVAVTSVPYCNCELSSVRGPVCSDSILEQFARSSPILRYTGQVSVFEGDSKFAGTRNGQELAGRQIQGSLLASIRAGAV